MPPPPPPQAAKTDPPTPPPALKGKSVAAEEEEEEDDVAWLRSIFRTPPKALGTALMKDLMTSDECEDDGNELMIPETSGYMINGARNFNDPFVFDDKFEASGSVNRASAAANDNRSAKDLSNSLLASLTNTEKNLKDLIKFSSQIPSSKISLPRSQQTVQTPPNADVLASSSTTNTVVPSPSVSTFKSTQNNSFIQVTAQYPRGHITMPPRYIPLPSDNQITFVSQDHLAARTYLGYLADQVCVAYQKAGETDMHKYEISGPWEALNAHRWMVDDIQPKAAENLAEPQAAATATTFTNEEESLSMEEKERRLREEEMLKIQKVRKIHDLMMAQAAMESLAQEGGTDANATEWFNKLIDLTATHPSFVKDKVHVQYQPMWPGSHFSTSALNAGRNIDPFASGSRSRAPFKEDENDESPCRSYCDFNPRPRSMGIFEQVQKMKREEAADERAAKMGVSRGIIDIEDMDMVQEYIRRKFAETKEHVNHHIEAAETWALIMKMWWVNADYTLKNLDWYKDDEGRIRYGYRSYEDFAHDLTWIVGEMELAKKGEGCFALNGCLEGMETVKPEEFAQKLEKLKGEMERLKMKGMGKSVQVGAGAGAGEGGSGGAGASGSASGGGDAEETEKEEKKTSKNQKKNKGKKNKGGKKKNKGRK